MRNWGIDRAWHRDPNALWETKVRGQVMTHSCPPQFSLSARTGQCVCLCCFSPQFAHNDLQNQAAATLKDKEEKIVCLCVCVCLCLAERHRAWHGIFYMVRLASWWLKSEFARRSDDHPGNFSSRFLIFFFPFLSRGHFNLPPPRVDVIVCFCIHSVGILARK